MKSIFNQMNIPLIKLKKNHDLLKKCIEEKEFPDLDKVNMDNDPNMRFIKTSHLPLYYTVIIWDHVTFSFVLV